MKKIFFALLAFCLLSLQLTVLAADFAIEQGQLLKIRFPIEKSTYAEVIWGSEKIILQKSGKFFVGYIGEHRLSENKTKDLIFRNFQRGKGFQEQKYQVEIKKRVYPVIRFNLSQQNTKLFGADYQTPTWEAIYGAMENPTSTQLWKDFFITPATGRTTLGFGDLLYINNKYSGSHFGMDYANKTGTDVVAANDGIVKLAEFTPAYGETILIDHGLNVFTMYLHLDKINVKTGQKVSKGEKIGEMGSTGISTGSHLHYTMFVGKTIVDSKWLEK